MLPYKWHVSNTLQYRLTLFSWFLVLVSCKFNKPSTSNVSASANQGGFRVLSVAMSPADPIISKAVSSHIQTLQGCGALVTSATFDRKANLDQQLQSAPISDLVLIEGHGLQLYSPVTGKVEYFWANGPGEQSLPPDLEAYTPARSVESKQFIDTLTKYQDQIVEANGIRDQIIARGHKAIWVDSCYGGKCIDNKQCIGSACSNTTKSYEANPFTESIIQIACAAASDCTKFNLIDKNGDACVDQDEYTNSKTGWSKKSGEGTSIVAESEVVATINSVKSGTTEIAVASQKELGYLMKVTIRMAIQDEEDAAENWLDPSVSATVRKRRISPSDLPRYLENPPQGIRDFPDYFASPTEANAAFEQMMRTTSLKLPAKFRERGTQRNIYLFTVEHSVSEKMIELTWNYSNLQADYQVGRKEYQTPVFGDFRICAAACASKN